MFCLQKGWLPLHDASCSSGKTTRTLRELIRHTSNIDTKDNVHFTSVTFYTLLKSQSQDGCTPLLRATRYRRKRSISILLKAGADIYAEDEVITSIFGMSLDALLNCPAHVLHYFCAGWSVPFKLRKEQFLQRGQGFKALPCNGPHSATRQTAEGTCKHANKQGKEEGSQGRQIVWRGVIGEAPTSIPNNVTVPRSRRVGRSLPHHFHTTGSFFTRGRPYCSVVPVVQVFCSVGDGGRRSGTMLRAQQET